MRHPISERAHGRETAGLAGRKLLLWLLCLLAIAGSWCRPGYTAPYGTNLLVNGNAEAGPSSTTGAPVSVPGWTVSSAFTVIPYGAPGGFPKNSDYGPGDRGNQFFAGGNAVTSTATQDINVAANASDFASGQVGCDLSGWLGGFLDQNDGASVSVTFFNGASNLGAFSIGPVTAADRSNFTSLHYRSNAAIVPTGTNLIRVTLIMNRTGGASNDGYADNISMILIPSIAVVNNNDSGPGSLRAAIAYANTHPGTTIRFASGVNSITLTSGQLQIGSNTTIQGLGNGYPYVSGNNITRIFNVNAGVTLNLNSVSVIAGYAAGTFNFGGGIANFGTLNMTGCNVTNCVVATTAVQGFGGGIANKGGTLTMADCTLSNNFVNSPVVSQSFGGAIHNDGGILNLTRTRVTGNYVIGSAGGNRYGGGISSYSINGTPGSVTLTDCVVSNNQCYTTSGGVFGGGLDNGDDGTMTLLRCTVSGNTLTGLDSAAIDTTDAAGAGINSNGPLKISNSTISGNQASSASHRSGGGGISAIFDSVTLVNCTISNNSCTGPFPYGGGAANSGVGDFEVLNTIIAGNTAGPAPDVYGAFASLGHNLVGARDFSDNGPDNSAWQAPGDQSGTAASPLNPRLGPLADNGGLSPTMPLLPGSPAINAGDDAVLASPHNLSTDQRGFARKQGSKVDIGAFEYDAPTSGTTLTVTTTHNHDDGACGPVDCTLWEAINAANANVDANSINFKAGLSGTITNNALSGGYTIFNPVTINGPGARVLSVNGVTNALAPMYTRVFNIATGGSATISGLTIANGNSTAVGFGGGFLNAGNLTLQNCALFNNAGTKGGGIYNSTGATLTMSGCTVRLSQTSTDGGIDNVNGTATLTNCTVTDGRAYYGAGINNEGIGATLTLRSCTITGNFLTGPPDGLGAGVRNNGGTVNIGNTIIAGNSIFGGSSEDVQGAFTSQGYNLIGNSDGSSGFTNGVNNDQVGDGDAVLGPGLGPLGNYGGATDTFSLLAGGPAIDKGHRFSATTDQRGQVRPRDQAAIANASGGDGSDIGAFEAQPPSSISGRITDAQGTAIVNVIVTRSGNNLPAVQTTTNSAGYFTLANVADGTYTLTPSLANYSFTPVTRSVTVGGGAVGGMNFIGKTGVNVSGRIASAAGVAIGSVTLSRSGSAQTVQTNSAGYYTFIGLQPGSVTITPSKAGYRFTPISKVVSIGASDVSGINFIGASGYNIVGRIANSGGVGQANIVVKRSGSNITATTNSAGYYTFIDVPNGSHTITPTGSGLSFAPESRSVVVNSADVSGQNFTVAPGYTVIGRIMTSAGVAIANVVVTRSGSAVTATTNSAGYFTISNVANGTYTLTPARAGYSFTPVSKSVTVNGANVAGQNFIGAG